MFRRAYSVQKSLECSEEHEIFRTTWCFQSMTRSEHLGVQGSIKYLVKQGDDRERWSLQIVVVPPKNESDVLWKLSAHARSNFPPGSTTGSSIHFVWKKLENVKRVFLDSVPGTCLKPARSLAPTRPCNYAICPVYGVLEMDFTSRMDESPTLPHRLQRLPWLEGRCK